MAEISSSRYSALMRFRAPRALSEAVATAAARSLTTPSEYARRAIFDRLRADGIAAAEIEDGEFLEISGGISTDAAGDWFASVDLSVGGAPLDLMPLVFVLQFRPRHGSEPVVTILSAYETEGGLITIGPDVSQLRIRCPRAAYHKLSGIYRARLGAQDRQHFETGGTAGRAWTWATGEVLFSPDAGEHGDAFTIKQVGA